MVSLCGINSITVHPSPSQKSVPMVFMGWGHCSGFFFLHDVCDAIPCSVIFFPDQSGCCKQSCRLQQHTVPRTTRKHFFTEVCAPPSASEKCSRHNLSSFPNFVPFSGPHGMLFQSLLPFPWRSQVNSLRPDHQFLFCCSWYRQFARNHKGADWQCLCSCLQNALPIIWHC